MKKPQKMFVVRKYIMANSAQEAIRKEKTRPVDDAWVDEDWKQGKYPNLEKVMGFKLG